MKNKIKKILLLLTPPVILNLYYKIKRRKFPPIKRKNNKTSLCIITTKTFPINESFIKEKKVDIIRVELYMEWINPFNTRDIRKYQYNEFDFSPKGKTEIALDFTNFGLWTICINYYCNKKCIKKEAKAINIEAPEYNIAYLAATLPVEIFITKLWDITTHKSPTIIGLERVLINYEALPQNVFPFPLASKEELYTPYKGFNRYSQRLVSYIGTLHRLNPDAKFNLYLCDHQAYYSLALLYANGIPERNFKVFLLSDGIGSYWSFHSFFNQLNIEKTYCAMRDIWNFSKQKALESGVQEWKKESFVKCGNPCLSKAEPIKNNMVDLSNRFVYAYIMVKENSNFRWILHNPQLLKSSDMSITQLPNTIKKVNFVKGIRELEKHKSDLVSMTGINYSIFNKSCQKNKKICLFVCSFPPSPNDEKYIDKTMVRFGVEYDYYIKEHPWTTKDAKRIKRFESKGIIFIDPKIPTEFYLMINPRIYIAGYISALFLSIDLLESPTTQILSIWNSTECRIKTECLDFTAKTAMSIEKDKVVVYEKTNQIV